MGKQVGFYAVDEDYTGLLRYAEEMGLRAIPELIPVDTDVESVNPTKFRLSDGQEFFYLIPEDFGIGEAIYVEMTDEPGLARLNASGSPVIELGACQQIDNRVYNSRIYLGLESNDEFYSATLTYFNRLARYIRKWAKTNQFGFYVGPHTTGLAQGEIIRLMHHQIEVHVA